MKKIIILYLILAVLLSFISCDESSQDDGTTQTEIYQTDTGRSDNGSTAAEPEDSEDIAGSYYKTVIVTDCSGVNTLLYGLDGMGIGNGAGEAVYFGHDNALMRREYHNRLIINYDTQTGKCVSVKLELYTGDESEAQNIVSMLQGGGDIDAHLSGEKVETVGNDIYRVCADVDVSTYFANIDSFVNTYLIEGVQNVDGFKNAVYYDRLSNYGEGSVLYVEDDAEHFYGSIVGLALDYYN